LEKGVPPFFAYEAMLRALELITASCPATKLSSKILDIKNYHEEKRIIDLHHDSIKRIAGIDCSPEETKSILEKLGFKIETDLPGHFGVEIPGFRFSDINIEADLIEEVARIYGYNKIEAIIPKAPVKVANLPLDKKLAKIIQNFLVATGMFEVYTFSFLGKELIKKMEESIDQSYIHIANYISEDMSLLRQSLLPRLLEIIEKNLRYQNEVNVFELGKVFYKIEEKIQESRLLTGLFCGENSSFRQAKGCVETLLTKLNLEPSFAYIEKNLFPFVHPGNNAEIFVHNKSIGLITDLHPLIKKNFGIEKPVSLFEIDFEMLVNIGLKLPIYTPLPKYPTITLDISILIPKRDLAQKYLDIIKNTNKLLIKNIKIIDEYIGNQIPANQRSLTFSIVFAAEERTLKEEEAFTIQQMIIQELKKAGAELRA
jgi:phenylalanyl-tRNA synthetase beta chain